MSDIRIEVIYAVLNKTRALIDYNIHNDLDGQRKFREEMILADKSLTKDEKVYAIKELNKIYDRNKIQRKEGTKRICENCNQECSATSYCENCIRDHLKKKFSNWTSGNDNIDKLIQECQLKTIAPDMIVEWIPYNKLQNIEYLAKGGSSDIYKAIWIDGNYEEWDSKEHQLKRFGKHDVVLKKLENSRWFEEAESHLTRSNKWVVFVRSYGLTQDPSSGDYMLVIRKMATDLRTYLQQNHNQLTWKERIQIAFFIIHALSKIHNENSIHRNLHSGNILHDQLNQKFRIGDLGFCGPATDRPSEKLYGNLPYIAPEVICGKKATLASDIYSVAMLMWETSSGQPPFVNYEHNSDLAMSIVNGIRPKIVPGTPSEYKNLMEQCWDADPLKRPDLDTLLKRIREINLYYHQNETTQSEIETNDKSSTSSKLYTSKASKFHQFENFPEPRNATAEEQEAFHSKSHDINISDNV